MIARFSLQVFVFALMFLPFSSKAEASTIVFEVSGQNLKEMCENNTQACELWIEGVIEGMEFSYKLLLASELPPNSYMFCFDENENYLQNIRNDFVKKISEEEHSDMINQPAVLTLFPSLHKYKCR